MEQTVLSTQRLRPAVAGLIAAFGLAAAALVAGPVAGSVAADSGPQTPTILVRTSFGQTAHEPFTGEDFAAVSQQQYPYNAFSNPTGRCQVDFGDGAGLQDGTFAGRHTPAPCQLYHTYDSPGTYTITMRVTDESGQSAQSSRDVTVVARPSYTVKRTHLEGDKLTLRAKGGASSTYWTQPGRNCAISDETSPTTTLRCDQQGVADVYFDGDTVATSGVYHVKFVNGAPRPTVPSTRRRVGTGDVVAFPVDARDPSWRGAADPDYGYTGGLQGDGIHCVFRFGDGTTERLFVDNQDACTDQHVYDSAGRYKVRIKVTDEDGASAATKTVHVQVVRRDVHVASSGRQSDGFRGRFRGVLTPKGVGGSMHFTTSDGDRVVVPHVTVLEVNGNSTSLGGPARVNGKTGYRASAEIRRRGKQAVLAAYSDSDGVYQSQDRGSRESFTTVYQVKQIR